MDILLLFFVYGIALLVILLWIRRGRNAVKNKRMVVSSWQATVEVKGRFAQILGSFNTIVGYFFLFILALLIAYTLWVIINH
jgi:hypothetical protein